MIFGNSWLIKKRDYKIKNFKGMDVSEGPLLLCRNNYFDLEIKQF